MKKDVYFNLPLDDRLYDWITEKESTLPFFKSLGDLFCSSFDVVVVSDINPDARFLLQRIADDATSCALKKFVILTTNRFDYHEWFDIVDGGNDMIPYKRLLERISTYMKVRSESSNPHLMGPEVLFVANNPWEEKYAQAKFNGRRVLNVSKG